MQNYVAYHQFATLPNGRKVVIRFLNGRDRAALIQFFQAAPKEDLQFCKEDVKNPRVVDYWLKAENAQRIMALVAEDLAAKKIVASLNLYRGQHAALNVGEIHQILVARPFQGLGLGSLILDQLIDLTAKANFHWLKVEVITELKNVIKAFQSRGFKVRATLEDYFRDLQGATYDVVLMMRNLLKEEDDF
ncbi:MAG: GNAT family N-acetyltransferase [Syntrophobacterales bacterium]|jgi:L-amino acid N-acyltransferase YncA|nr:GNAT family N-acetyltransferase [Syntrophobacterales bacterium]